MHGRGFCFSPIPSCEYNQAYGGLGGEVPLRPGQPEDSRRLGLEGWGEVGRE